MANVYTTPDPDDAADWPDVERLIAGEVIKGSDFVPLINLANCALACTSTGPLIQQSWVGGIEWDDLPIVDGDDPFPMFRWRIPIISNRHMTLRIRVLGQRVEYAGVSPPVATATFKSVSADTEVTIDLPEVLGWVEDTLDIDVGEDRHGDRVDELQMFMQGTFDEIVQWGALVYQVVIDVVEISSPLPAARVDGAVPIGEQRAGDDSPLSTCIAEWLIGAIEAVATRPIIGLLWSAIDPVYADEYPEFAVVPPSIGVESAVPVVANHGVVAHVRVSDDRPRLFVAPVAREVPARIEPTWMSQHSPRVLASDPLPAGPAGVTRVGVGADIGAAPAPIGMHVWMREDVTGDVTVWGEDNL